jgi:putative ABC transport system ATP-binding protein
MVRSGSINTGRMRVIAISLANGCTGLSGALLAQYQGFSDINSGSGIVIIGLASVIIGEAFIRSRNAPGVGRGLVAACAGSVIYRLLIAAVLALNIFPAYMLKLLSALIVALALAMPKLRVITANYLQRRRRKAASINIQPAEPRSDALRTKAGSPILELRNVTKTYGKGSEDERKVLDNLSLSLYPGDFVTIIGSNGAGKSTLFSTIAGTILPDEGAVFISGKDVTTWPDYKRAHNIGRMFQDTRLGTIPALRIEENLALVYARADGRPILARALRRSDRDLFRRRLGELDMGLEKRLATPAGLLSGGQRQALSLLIATFTPPAILLLDEHTAALDPQSSRKVLDETRKIAGQNSTATLMITHNISSALELGNRTIMLRDGRIVMDISGEERARTTPAQLLERYRELAE